MSSARDDLGRRERIAFERAEQQERIDAEDHEQYRKYVGQLECEQARTAPAFREAPLDFETWRKYMPADESNPEVRAAIATNRSLIQNTMKVARDRIAGTPLTDDELQTLGYDISERCEKPELELTTGAIVEFFSRFADMEPRFDRKTHVAPVGAFLARNRLLPVTDAIARTFYLLESMHLIEPKPERSPELNEYEVNLHITPPSPEFLREQQQRDYFTKIIVVDPRDGKPWTQYQLDRTDAANLRRLLKIAETIKRPL